MPAIQNRHSNILDTLEAYASIAQRCADDAKQSKLIASYQKFILGALCQVACCTGVDEKLVNKMMVLISNGGSDHLRQTRLGVAWAVTAIDRLQTESDWGIRSGDIFFYFLPSFTSLGRWAKANLSMNIFTTSLIADQCTKGQDHLHTNHLSVPCIIKCILGKSVLLSDICTSLHADLNTTRGIFVKWHLEAFGSHSMDNLEQQKLFYSIRSLLPYPASSQRSNYFDPVRDAPNEARKRRRTSDCPRETSVDSDDILTVNLSTPVYDHC